MNTGHNKRILIALISSALLSVTSFGVSAATQVVRMGSLGVLQASQGNAASQQLRQVLSDVARARTELKNTQPEQAKETLMHAQANMQKITNTYGSGIASIYISSEHKVLNFGADDAVREPGTPSLHQLDDVETALTKGEFDKAAETVNNIDYPLVFASVDIPLSQTQSSINTAISMIESNKTTKAAHALEMAKEATLTSSGLFDGDFNKS